MKRPCHFCDAPVDALSPYTFRQVLGWTRKRSGGGVNQITAPEGTGAVACPPCIDLRKPKKGHLAQEGLF